MVVWHVLMPPLKADENDFFFFFQMILRGLFGGSKQDLRFSLFPVPNRGKET